ncbi:MAG: bifunctional riboflavin kinase/FAD synthetase [Flavobacteriales bacterium]|nr:bifunctional riboflavin kinase/FAD synthetase [Flavobacteriales bacterium]
MRVFRSIDAFEKVNRAVVTTGTFDGVHIGHRRIIGRMTELARKVDGESVLLTFDPHPRMVLFPDDHGLQLLSTLDEKIALLEEAGIDNLIVHPFTKEFSRISSMDFVRKILADQLGTHRLVIGYDHHFGRNREGSFEHLKEYGPLYGFEVEEIPAQEVDDVSVSSTKVRRALAEGDVATASEYLGADYRLSGQVVEGRRLGRTLGFPTANIRVSDPHKLIPANGVYAANMHINGKKFGAMLNIGYRPTVDTIPTRTIEAHIFDFDGDLYGASVEVRFRSRIRDERKFDSVDELRMQLEMDSNKARQLL